MYLFRSLTILALGIVASCDEAASVTPPCPRPSFTLTPQLDTIEVGASLRFEIRYPLEQPGQQRRLFWSTSDAAKVTVDQSGLAVARAVGTVQVDAIDRNSPANCPDMWYGTLVVE
jgi:hypothetical protein